MRKKLLVLGVSVCVLAMSGCGLLKKRHDETEVLKQRLSECRDRNSGLEQDLLRLRGQKEGLEQALSEAQEKEQKLTELLGKLREDQDALQRQRLELQELVKDLSGVSVVPGAEGNFIVLESEILFALGKAELSEKAKKSLDSIAEYLRKRPDQQVRIDGHTDGVPIRHSAWQDNYHLSAMRAQAVRRYLASKGVAEQRLYIVGFGPNRPRVEPENRTAPVAANRRVEILLVPERGGGIEEILKKFQP